jgi:hypothetical protein
MKKLLFATIALASLCGIFASAVFAEEKAYGMAGCGLGSLIFGNTPDRVSQVVAVTTNGTSYNQYFALSSGTSNCPSPTQTASRERLNEFVVANFDSLAKEIAMGHGESLDTLAELMGISADKKQEVYAKFQSNFSKIFPSTHVQAAEVISNIVTALNS